MPIVNPDVESYFANLINWKQELLALRKILLECGLSEEYKWRQPCYTYQQKNIAILGAFKKYCVLSFFKGSLLQDSNGILSSPGENSQATRQVRFSNFSEIPVMATILKKYIFEAIEIDKAGLKINFKMTSDCEFPEELKVKFEAFPALKNKFKSLTPGRQKAYLLYFSAPKQSITKLNRIEKNIPRIMDGKGLHDCICGRSARIPQCDGSHNK